MVRSQSCTRVYLSVEHPTLLMVDGFLSLECKGVDIKYLQRLKKASRGERGLTTDSNPPEQLNI